MPGVCDPSLNFEPTFTFMGFQYLSLDVRPPFAVEGRRAVEVTHLALARRQNRGDGILGILQIKAAACGCFFDAVRSKSCSDMDVPFI